jgi:hypothetical protein
MSTCFSELCSASWSRYCIQSGTKNNRLSISPWSNTPLIKIIPITLADPNLSFLLYEAEQSSLKHVDIWQRYQLSFKIKAGWTSVVDCDNNEIWTVMSRASRTRSFVATNVTWTDGQTNIFNHVPLTLLLGTAFLFCVACDEIVSLST